MTYNKRKKNIRLRGSKTHGYGSKKKNRGKGNKGGSGKAGTGKRADQNKPRIWKDTKYFGKHGFKPPRKEKISAINFHFLEEKFNSLLKKGILKEQNGKYKIDLSDIKINKLLSKGEPTRPYDIKVKYATARAIEKIKKAGGNVTINQFIKNQNNQQSKQSK